MTSAPAATNYQDLARRLKALGDQHRIRILHLLADRGPMCVTDLGAALGLTQPAVSHHLSQLWDARMVTCERTGKYNYYSLDLDGLRAAFGGLFPGRAEPFPVGRVASMLRPQF